jgi:hypothetical protein
MNAKDLSDVGLGCISATHWEKDHNLPFSSGA